jgi:hypothetical protein
MARIVNGYKHNMVSLQETTATAQQLKKGSALLLSDTPHPIEQVNINMLAEKIIPFS